MKNTIVEATSRKGRGWRILAAVLAAAAPASMAAAAAPVIDVFEAVPATIAPGGVVTVTVEAHDPDCPGTCTSGCGQTIRQDLTSWTVTGGTILLFDNGVTGSPYTASIDWQAPAAEGAYTISVSLSDSGNFLCGGRQTVTADLTVQVTLSTNQAPVIGSLTADPVQIRPLQSSSLLCVASDADADPITYGWATDMGTITDLGGGSATFSAPAAPGVATVTCTASDPDGFSDSQSVPVSVGDTVASGSIRRGFGAPQSVAINDLGDLFVVDRWAGGLAVSNLFDDGVGRVLPIDGIGSVAVDWNNHPVIGTTSGARVIDDEGSVLLLLPAPDGFPDVADVAVDSAANHYVVLYREAARIAVYNQTGSLIGLFGTTGSGPGEMNAPSGVAVSAAGEIVVADTGHGLVQVFSSTGAFVRAFGGLGPGPGEFVSLVGVAADGAGRIYASDAYHSRVQVFNADGTLREIIGLYGDAMGEFMTPVGLAASDVFETLAVTSFNTPSVELFRLGDTVFAPPVISVAPANLDFGDQLVGTVSTAQWVTVSNPGSVSVALYGAEATGDFGLSSGCGTSLLPGTSCNLAVTFAPTAAGVRTGDLSISSSSTDSPHSIALSGNGLPIPFPVVTLAPATADFGGEYVGFSSPAQTFVLSNSGTGPATISGITTGTQFPMTTNCGSSLAAGSSCAIDVVFAPTVEGSASGTLAVIDDAVGSPHSAILSGTGLEPPVMVVSPLAIDFGAVDVGVTADAVPVVITNTGSGLLTVTGFVVQGDFAQTNTCLTPLASGGQCSAFVRFTPTLAGPRTGSMEIQNDGPNGSQTVTLTGAGVGDPAVVASPTELVFAVRTVGQASPPQSVQITNSGEGPLEIATVSIDGINRNDFSVTLDSCTGASLAPAGFCSVSVVFEPTLDGERSGVLSVGTNAAGSPTTVPLSGGGEYITTTIATGEDPPDAALCGDEGSAFVDAFSLWTDREIDHVGFFRVDMPSGSADVIGLIEVIDAADGQVVGSVGNPTDDSVFLGVDLDVTVEPTDYLIRLTPRNQADMPPPPGSEVTTRASIGAVGNDNLIDGWDETLTQLTIDNLSPGAPTFESADASGSTLILTWSNPSDPDFDEVVVLRAPNAQVADRPTEGLTYAVGDTVGVATVACVGPGPTCVDGNLSPGVFYHYAFFARDECGNYSDPDHSGAVQAPLGEAIPTLDGWGRLLLILLMGLAGILVFRWRMR